MRRSIIFITMVIVVFSAFQPCYAQTTANINGIIRSADGHGIDGANILLLNKDSVLKRSSISGADGTFSLDKVPYGSYIIKVNHLSYLGSSIGVSVDSASQSRSVILDLQNSASTLKEVSIKSKKPLIEKKLNKIILNVSESIIDANDNVFNILQKAPSVAVNYDNKLTISGRPGVLILMDGRETHLSPAELARMLQNLPGNNIERIEIISTPSSKYEASGSAGIIDIITKKDKALGYASSITTGFAYGKKPKYNGSYSGNYRSKNVLIYGTYDYANNKNVYLADQVRSFNTNQNNSLVYDQRGRIDSHSENNYYKGGIDLFIDNNNTLGFIYAGYNNRSNSTGINTTDIGRTVSASDSSITSRSSNSNKSINNSFNLNYSSKLFKKLSMSANFDYSKFDGSVNSIIDNTFYNSSAGRYLVLNDLPVEIDIKSAKIDLSMPVSKFLTVEAGAKFSKTNTDNNFVYKTNQGDVTRDPVTDTMRTNHFLYGETINAFYGTGKGKLGKLEYEMGIRGEQTISIANSLTSAAVVNRNYFNLFPTLSVGYNLFKNQQTEFSYSRRIDRPQYSELNPFLIYNNPYSYEQGNPYLKPAISENYQISQTISQKYFVSFGYSFTRDIPTVVYIVQPGTEITKVTTENISSLKNYTLNLSFPILNLKGLKSRTNISTYYNKYAALEGNADPNSKLTVAINLNNQLDIFHVLQGEVSAMYMSPSAYGVITTKSVFSLNLGLKKSVNKQFDISLTAKDIFNTVKTAGNIKYNNADIFIYQKSETRQVKLSLSYKLGKKTVKLSQPKKSGVEEEKGRVKIGN